MGKLQEEQAPFDRAVCDAMVVSAPEDWDVIVLTIERPTGASGMGELSHSLCRGDGSGSATPDDSLYEATYRLDELFHRHESTFRRAVYRVELFPNSWKYAAEFEYDPPQKKRTRKA